MRGSTPSTSIIDEIKSTSVLSLKSTLILRRAIGATLSVIENLISAVSDAGSFSAESVLESLELSSCSLISEESAIRPKSKTPISVVAPNSSFNLEPSIESVYCSSASLSSISTKETNTTLVSHNVGSSVSGESFIDSDEVSSSAESLSLDPSSELSTLRNKG